MMGLNVNETLRNTYVFIRYRDHSVVINYDDVNKFMVLINELMNKRGVRTYTYPGVIVDTYLNKRSYYVDFYVIGSGVVMYMRLYPAFHDDKDMEARIRDFPSVSDMPYQVEVVNVMIGLIIDSYDEFNDVQKTVLELIHVMNLIPQLIRPM